MRWRRGKKKSTVPLDPSPSSAYRSSHMHDKLMNYFPNHIHYPREQSILERARRGDETGRAQRLTRDNRRKNG
jgi:hypothetical protein